MTQKKNSYARLTKIGDHKWLVEARIHTERVFCGPGHWVSDRKPASVGRFKNLGFARTEAAAWEAIEWYIFSGERIA